MFPYIGDYKISKKKSIQNLNSLGLGKLLIHNNRKITITRKKERRFPFSPSRLSLSPCRGQLSLSLWLGRLSLYGPVIDRIGYGHPPIDL